MQLTGADLTPGIFLGDSMMGSEGRMFKDDMLIKVHFLAKYLILEAKLPVLS